MSNAHEREPKPEIERRGPEVEKKEWSEIPTEGLKEILPSEDELDRLHEEKLKKMPPSEVQKIIKDLQSEDEEERKRNKEIDRGKKEELFQ